MGKPSELIFTKSWLKREDFPTYEASEDNVRADMQYLHDETANAFNNLVNNEFVAEKMGFAPYSGIQQTDVQHAVQYVYDQIGEIGEGSVIDGTITTVKLHSVEGEEAVTTETIRDGAITTDKIDNEQVTYEKLAPDVISTISSNLTIPPLSIRKENIVNYEVTDIKLANNSVTRDKILNGEVVLGKIGEDAVISDNIADNQIKEDHLFKTAPNQAVSTQTIRDNAITYDKLRKTTGSEAVDTGAIRNNAVTYDKLKHSATGNEQAVGTDAIRPGAVTYAKLSSEVQGMLSTGGISENSITYDMLRKRPTYAGQEAVGTNAIREGAVTNDKLAGDITSDKFAEGVLLDIASAVVVTDIQGSQIADDAITSDKILENEVKTANLDKTSPYQAVSTDTIRDYAVTAAKLNSDVTTFINGLISSAVLTSDNLPQVPGTEAVIEDTIGNGAVTYNKLGSDVQAIINGAQEQHTMVGPITVATSAWSSNVATVSVTGVSLTDVATQKVDWTPASDADWQIVSDCKVRCDRVPPSNNNVTLRCTTTPESSISLYFSIFD